MRSSHPLPSSFKLSQSFLRLCNHHQTITRGNWSRGVSCNHDSRMYLYIYVAHIRFSRLLGSIGRCRLILLGSPRSYPPFALTQPSDALHSTDLASSRVKFSAFTGRVHFRNSKHAHCIHCSKRYTFVSDILRNASGEPPGTSSRSLEQEVANSRRAARMRVIDEE